MADYYGTRDEFEQHRARWKYTCDCTWGGPFPIGVQSAAEFTAPPEPPADPLNQEEQ